MARGTTHPSRHFCPPTHFRNHTCHERDGEGLHPPSPSCPPLMPSRDHINSTATGLQLPSPRLCSSHLPASTRTRRQGVLPTLAVVSALPPSCCHTNVTAFSWPYEHDSKGLHLPLLSSLSPMHSHHHTNATARGFTHTLTFVSVSLVIHYCITSNSLFLSRFYLEVSVSSH